MSEVGVPCPMCGSENEPGAAFCTICGFSLQPASNVGGHKCARCGSNVPEGFDFCPVCGLDQRHRFARPATQIVRIDTDTGEPLSPPHGDGAGQPSYVPPQPEPAPAVDHGPMYAQSMPPAVAHPSSTPGAAAVPPSAVSTAQAGVPGGVPPSAAPGPAAQPGQAPAPAPAPAKTGRTVFMDGPPLARPPEPSEDDRTIPAPGKLRVREAPAGGGAAPVASPSDDAPTTAEPVVSVPPMLPPDMDDLPTNIATVGASVGVGATAGPRLVLVGRDGEEGDAFAMHGASLSIGRQHGDLVFADDTFMSPQHARVERSGDVHTLVDLGSSNGVYLRIRGNASVYPGDLFMVGHQVLRLENISDPVGEQAPAPDGTRLFGTPLKPAWGKLSLIGRGGIAGDTFFLRGAKVIFGREQGDILFPHDPFVSREHARLRLELHGAQMSVFLEDLGSANGTYTRIRGSSEIRGRDTFRVGDQILRLRLDDQ